ncbi:hypothetical protein LMG33818_000058 [Halomonadaceae bacterium LMG 33818]|uniref:baseplate hub protein n=1 Tax=Cernens ardua TaxID=3402176 RepID=UPI003EDC8A9C
MAYQERRIKVSIRLSDLNAPENQAFEDGNNTLVIDNCKAVCSMSVNAGLGGGDMQMTLWGLSLGHISKIVGPGILQFQNGIQNEITVWANDDVFFRGIIIDTQMDSSRAPDLVLKIHGKQNGLATQFLATSPTFIGKPTSFIEICKIIAQKAGLSVNSYIDDFTVSRFHAEGSVKSQLDALAESYRNKKIGIVHTFGHIDIIGYISQADDGTEADIEISPENGLIGYPSFTMKGIQFNCMYRPEISMNSIVKLTTNLPNASGRWNIWTVVHQISAWVEGGPWYSSVTAGTISNG